MSPVSTQTAQHLRKWLAAIDSGEVSVVNDPADIPALREMVAALARHEEGREADWPRYRLEVEGSYGSWCVTPVRDPRGEWCKHAEVKRGAWLGAFSELHPVPLDNEVGNGPDHEDGCSLEGFSGGCERMGCHPSPPSSGEGEALSAAIDRLGVAVLANDFSATKAAWFEVRRLATPTPQAEGRVGEMTPERACYFLRRFKADEKMLGPNEQWALDFAIERCTPTPQAAGVSEDSVKRAAAAIANARAGRRGAPEIANVLSILPKKLLDEVMEDAHAALTAAGAAPEGWQPIETAPKDGTAIIGGNTKWLRCAIFEWDDEFNNWWTDDIEANGTVPTHWQPMPASPTAPNPGAQHGQEVMRDDAAFHGRIGRLSFTPAGEGGERG